MCVHCISASEQIAADAALAFAVLRHPLHQALATAGIVAPPDPVRRDARTVGFLRALQLEPVDILGADVVDRADAWVAEPAGSGGKTEPAGSGGRAARQARGWRWLRPIGSHSLLSAQ